MTHTADQNDVIASSVACCLMKLNRHRQTNRHTGRRIYKQASSRYRHADNRTSRPTYRYVGRQTGTDTHTDKQADRHMCLGKQVQTHRQMNRHSDRYM